MEPALERERWRWKRMEAWWALRRRVAWEEEEVVKGRWREEVMFGGRRRARRRWEVAGWAGAGGGKEGRREGQLELAINSFDDICLAIPSNQTNKHREEPLLQQHDASLPRSI